MNRWGFDWTKEEIQQLRALALDHTKSEIAKFMNRSIDGVRRKVNDLKIKTKRQENKNKASPTERAQKYTDKLNRQRNDYAERKAAKLTQRSTALDQI